MINITSRKILIVDDEPAIIELFREFLADRFDVTFAAGGSQALDHLRSKSCALDLILLDHNLPDMSGIDVLKQSRKIRPCLPVIMVTAYGNEDIAANAFRCGVAEYIKKPFTQKDLVEKIDFCLALPKVPQKRIVTLEAEHTATHLLNEIKPDAKILKALDYINENFRLRLTLEVVADKACMSKFHFSRTFKEAVGCTYQDYLNAVRIQKAALMLTVRTLSITEIAYSVGYSDLTHFTRMFKQNIGFSPSSYRKKFLNAP